MTASTSGNINHAMRQNYDEFGVDEYYQRVAASYRNPFFPSIKQVVWDIFSRWYEHDGLPTSSSGIAVLDMAAGSGEVTVSLLEWAMPQTTHDVQPPSRAFIPPSRKQKRKRPDSTFSLKIIATDPYTATAYTDRTRRPCYPLSFSDLASGSVPPDMALPLDFVVCSFALHLVPTISELFALLYELSNKAKWLVIISPHKKPEIKDGWGWILWDSEKWRPASSPSEIVIEKTRLRIYRSVAF